MYLDWKNNAKDYWVVDTEADSLTPTRFWCAVACNLGNNEVLEFLPEDMNHDGRFSRFLETLPVVVGHNFLSFDNYHAGRLLGRSSPIQRVVDTLVLSYLYHPYLDGGHSLEAYGNRFKIPKIGHDDWSHFSPEMLARCRRDVEINVLTYKALCDRMNHIGFSEKSCEIEHRIRAVVDKQQRRGFYFNVEDATRLRASLEAQLTALEVPIGKLFPPTLTERGRYRFKLRADGQPYASYTRHCESYDAVQMSAGGDEYTVWAYEDFNIASSKQRIEKLLSLGWQPDEFTPAGNPKVNEDNLKKFADRSGIPEITAIADWLVRSTRVSTLTSWLGFAAADARIHGTVFTCGAATRRMRHNNPNTANIPSEANGAWLGAEMRSLWQATPGRVLMGYDASGLEMRGFCHYLWPTASEKDREYLVSQYIHGKPHQKNSEALTAALGFPVAYGGGGAKTLFYAFLYGAGDKKLGWILGENPSVGAQVRATLMASVPGLRDAVENVQAECRGNAGLIRTIDGGYVRCSGEHAALNYQIQSAGGIVMKEAAIIFDDWLSYNNVGDGVWKVGDIHDEAQQDCHDKEIADESGKAAVAAIRQAGENLNWNVPLDGEYKIGQNWHETH